MSDSVLVKTARTETKTREYWDQDKTKALDIKDKQNDQPVSF